MDEKQAERQRYDETMSRLRALKKQGLDVDEEIQAEWRRYHTVKARMYRKAHPTRAREAAKRYRDANLEKCQKLEKEYRKAHPEAQARGMRRWNARRKILAEFMAIDESIFE